jgi:hypothetical protein
MLPYSADEVSLNRRITCRLGDLAILVIRSAYFRALIVDGTWFYE